MRRFRTIFVLAAAACAVAIIAAPASAHQFTGSVPGEVHVEGVGPQSFSFKPFKITCEGAKSVKSGNSVTWPSPILYVAIKYSKCTTAAGKFHKVELPPIRTQFATPVDLEYHANRFVESGAESESLGEIKNAGSVVISVKGAFKCVLSWEPQTIPLKAIKKPTEEYEAASFEKEEFKTENLKLFPLGIQDKLLIANNLKHMKFTLEEGICEEFETTESKSGAYTGTLRAELKKGNLGWE